MINPNFVLTSKLKNVSKTLNFSQIRTISQQLLNPKPKIKQPKPKCSIKDKFRLAKQNWIFSLSNDIESDINGDNNSNNGGLKWVIGIDPDYNGALALLKYDNSGIISAEVYDSPSVEAPIGDTLRKRLDVRSIVQLVQSFGAPKGTIAYLEQSIPLTNSGKHIKSCWSGGFTNGLWMGVLVATGFSVVPVAPRAWKRELELDGGVTNKDQSRELATQLFPSLSSMFKRKMDHGRAEALLIAAYGNGHKIRTNIDVELDKKAVKLPKKKRKGSRQTPSAIEINETYESPGLCK